jgi:uncharacterized protein (TIGR00375 family)
MQMGGLDFRELKFCLENKADRRIVANYGLEPRLGKYHRSYCPRCSQILDDQPPVKVCRWCGNEQVVMGVYDRIVAIQDYDHPRHPAGRPPYYYRIPLKDLPGVGPKCYHRLLQAFPNEITLLEKAPLEEVSQVAGTKIASAIGAMRSGQLKITAGGGGRYGKVSLNVAEC